MQPACYRRAGTLVYQKTHLGCPCWQWHKGCVPQRLRCKHQAGANILLSEPLIFSQNLCLGGSVRQQIENILDCQARALDHGLAYRQQSILGLMDALGLETAILVGHSQAGNFAVALAEDYPARITHLVILGTGSLLPPLPGGEATKKKAPVEGREGTPREPTTAETRKLLEATVFHHALITEDELALRHSRSVGKNFAAFLARAETRSPSAKGGTPLWQRLAESSVPALLLYGKEDRANAFERATLFQEQYPNLNLHIVDGCKHLVPWDAADEWVRRTLVFLKQG